MPSDKIKTEPDGMVIQTYGTRYNYSAAGGRTAAGITQAALRHTRREALLELQRPTMTLLADLNNMLGAIRLNMPVATEHYYSPEAYSDAREAYHKAVKLVEELAALMQKGHA